MQPGHPFAPETRTMKQCSFDGRNWDCPGCMQAPRRDGRTRFGGHHSTSAVEVIPVHPV